MSLIINQFLLFAGVGVVGTLAHYAVLILLVQSMATNATIASTAGFVVGALTNYHLNYHYTFTSDKRHREAMTKFFTVAVIGLCFNGLVMLLCEDLLHIHYLLSQIFATGLVLFWNFFANRLWTFREQNPRDICK